MAKDSKDWMGAAESVGKAAVTGIPVAVLTDTVLYQYPTMGATNRELARVGAGLAVSAAALMFGAPVDYSIGPAVANLGVTGVEVGRRNTLGEKLRVKIAEMRAPAASNGVGRRY